MAFLHFTPLFLARDDQAIDGACLAAACIALGGLFFAAVFARVAISLLAMIVMCSSFRLKGLGGPSPLA